MMILARSHDEGTPWVVVGGLTFIAVVLLVSACFPNWKVKWGGPYSRGTIPMSVAGRVAFGLMPATFAIMAAINSKTFSYVGMVIYVTLFVATGYIYFRDKRNHNNVPLDRQEEN